MNSHLMMYRIWSGGNPVSIVATMLLRTRISEGSTQS